MNDMTDKLIDQYKRALGVTLAVLEFYAREDSYHAIAFLVDRPAGAFADDFSDVEGSQYGRPMPGKAARAALSELADKYPDLSYISQND